MKLKKYMKVVTSKEFEASGLTIPKGIPGIVTKAGAKKQSICFYNDGKSIVLLSSNNFGDLIHETSEQYCEDPIKDLTVKSIKYMRTVNGTAYSGKLYKENNLLGQIVNEGNGGATRFIPASIKARNIYANIVDKMVDVYQKVKGIQVSTSVELSLNEEMLLEFIFENEHFIKKYEDYLKN